MDSVRNATFRIGFPPPYVSLRSIRCKSLDRHMAAFSILKWQNSLQEGKSSLQNATRGFPYIRKWHSSLQEGKSLSRYNVTSFYPKMAIFNRTRQIYKNQYNSGVMVNYLSGVFTGGVYYYVYFRACGTVDFI